jgi:hypothetical protein
LVYWLGFCAETQPVAKKKNSPALYEMMSRSKEKQAKGGLVPPSWLTANAAGQRPASAAVVDRLPETQPPQQVAAEGAKPSTGMLGSRAAGQTAWRLPVPPKALVVGVAAVLVVALAVWGVAKVVAGKPSAASPAGGAGTGIVGAGAYAGPGDVAPADRVKGKYYLVIERLKGVSEKDWAEAKTIQTFLGERKYQGRPIVATIEKAGRNQDFYAIWTVSPGFDDPGSADAKAFALEVERLGREYSSKYGTYRFQQRARPTAELSPSYVQFQ